MPIQDLENQSLPDGSCRCEGESQKDEGLISCHIVDKSDGCMTRDLSGFLSGSEKSYLEQEKETAS